MRDGEDRPDAYPYVAIGFVVGVVIAAGVIAWQRSASSAEIEVLSRRWESAEASATAATQNQVVLEQRLAAAEASVALLAGRSAQLSSELASAQAARDSANAQAVETSRSVTITERSVSPSSVAASASITLQVKLTGKADAVKMRVAGQSGVAFSQTYTLTRSGSSGGKETWRRVVKAPPRPGAYRYYATAYVGSKAFEMPGVSAWSFQVKAAP
jgi:hypothetical protein